jgi:hypothetical protein
MMMYFMDDCLTMLNAHLGTLTAYAAMHQALANPKKSKELREFVQGIVHDETASLIREHNKIIQTQREQIALLDSQVDLFQRERMERINTHAAEITSLHLAHAAAIQALHGE